MLALASNLLFHTRTKHIKVDYDFRPEQVVCRDLAVKFVSSLDQLADKFTKSLPSQRFINLRSKIMITGMPMRGTFLIETFLSILMALSLILSPFYLDVMQLS